MPEPRKYLLVDGHSVIYAWPGLRHLHSANPAQARRELVGILQELQDASDWRVTVVFDGKFGTAPVRRGRDIVETYSTANETADSIIERMASGPGLAPHILVVTADEAERLTVESLGAECVSPEWLERETQDQRRNLDDALKHVHRRAKWSE